MVRTLFVMTCFLGLAGNLRAAEPKKVYELLPQSVQAVVLIPDSAVLAEHWNRTQLAELAGDPAVRDFWNDQQNEIEGKLINAGWRLHIHPRDLVDVVEGQLALAWIERNVEAPKGVEAPKVKAHATAKPFALAMLVDVVGKPQETTDFLKKLDEQLKKLGAKKSSVSHKGTEIVKHTLRPQGGELVDQETYYATINEQLFATDDLETIKGMLDQANATEAPTNKLNSDPVFIMARKELKTTGNGHVEYFVRPLGFARVIRAISGKKPGGNADVLAVLKDQGFEALKAVCGEIHLGAEAFDMVHHGFVLADPAANLGSEKFLFGPKSVQILDFPNEAKMKVPGWVTEGVSSMVSTCWNVKDAFWKAEGLVDQMAGQPKIFQEIVNGIKSDPTGPRIDIKDEVVPLLTNDIYSVADTKLPIEVDSRRNLIALRIKQPEKMAKILERAMQQEPDAEKVILNGQQIWQVARPEEDDASSLERDFGDFNKGNAKANQGNANDDHLLSNWAITVHGDYLMFASHVDMIVEAIEQAKKGVQSPLTKTSDYERVAAALVKQFGDEPACVWQINRSALSYQTQYELFRAGKLQGFKGMFSSIAEHLLQSKSEIAQKKPVDGSKLPPFDEVRKYLQPSGMMIQTTKNGWSFGSLLLSKAELKGLPATVKSESNAAAKPDQNAATTR